MTEPTPPQETTPGVYLDGRNLFPHGEAHRRWDPDDPEFDAAAREAEENEADDEQEIRARLRRHLGDPPADAPSPFRRHAPLIARAAIDDFLTDGACTGDLVAVICAYLRECERGAPPGAVSAERIPQAWREGYAAAVRSFDEAVEGLAAIGKNTELAALLRDQAFDTEEAGQ